MQWAVAATVAKLMLGLSISKTKPADDLKAVISFFLFNFDATVQMKQQEEKQSKISGQSVLQEAGKLHSISHA